MSWEVVVGMAYIRLANATASWNALAAPINQKQGKDKVNKILYVVLHILITVKMEQSYYSPCPPAGFNLWHAEERI